MKKIMAESITGREEINSDRKERKRKPNFSVYEIGVITENVKKHLETIQSKLTNNVSNKKKQEIWEEVTRAVNAVGTANRTVSEVKDKWKNLHSTAKKSSLNSRENQRRLEEGHRRNPQVSQVKKLLKCLKKRQVSAA